MMSRSLLGVVSGLLCLASGLRAADWPRWMGPHGDLTWREPNLLKKFPESGPKILWRAPAANSYSGPAVAGGDVIVFDYVIREGKPDANPGGRTKIQGEERVRALDAATGAVKWTYRYDQPLELSFPNGPRATPTVDGDKVYVLGAEGRLTCLTLADGKRVWDVDFKKTYGVPSPIWGFSGHPVVHGDLVYCLPGGEGTTVVAFNKNTGKEVWRSLSAKEPGYAPVKVVNHGGKEQVIVWTSDELASLNPADGKPYWRVPFAPNYSMSIMTPQVVDDLLFAGGQGKKSILLKLKPDQSTPDIVWEGTPRMAIAPKNATPVFADGLMYGCDSDGELRCVDLKTGERLWTSEEAVGGKAQNSGTFFMVKTDGGHWVIFNEKGELILAEINREGYRELSKHQILEPTSPMMGGRKVAWAPPAYAHGCVYVKNDNEILCVVMTEDQKPAF